MGYEHTPIETETKVNQDNPVKTETTLTGGQTIVKAPHQAADVKADTRSDPDNPAKTITTLSEDKKFKVTVTGEEFSGTVEVSSGIELKYALMYMVKEGSPSYGNFKYRDSEDKPVAITHVVDSDLNLRSIRRGE